MTKDELFFRIEQDPEYVLANSFRHCHTKEVTSIGLHSNDREGLRVFLAHPGHKLFTNHIEEFMFNRRPMSVGIHPHRRALFLNCFVGSIVNVSATLLNEPDQWCLRKCEFRSRILGERGEIKLMKGAYHFSLTEKKIQADTSQRGIALKASDLHTIAVESWKKAAWSVSEGLCDPDFKAVMYTNAPPTPGWDEGLYEKFESINAIKIHIDNFYQR